MKAVLCMLISAATILAAALAQTSPPEYGFLTERVSITNKDGIVGFPPGTRVEILHRNGSKLSVRAEDKTFEVRTDQITSDVAAGNALHQQDAATQAAVQQQLSATAMTPAEPKQVHSQSTAAPATVDARAQAPDRLAQIHKQREELKIELDRVKLEQKGLPKPNSKKYAWGHLKRFGSSPNAEKLATEQKELEQKIFDLQEEEKR